MNLKNKTALITGGAVRVGRAISLELARAGCHIFCQYYSSGKEASSLKDKVQNSGGKIEIFKSDLTGTQSPKKVTEAALQAFGSIDILVNNSALFHPTPFGKVSEKDWHTFHDLNLKAAFFLSQEVGMVMKKKKSGRIINIGDTSYNSPWPDYLPYTLSKAGINTMTQGLAKALAPYVLVNCINPGPVMVPEDYSEEQHATAIKRTLLQRVGSAEDIAKTARFLAESDYITGALVPVDGGRHLG